ncbi:HGGxSTG domain-containing protein [Altericroceibacterium xinjiangense]|uniref:HGGxSTG domain-containing protein n=1 Tax=Altericroceibacterium xinjiangense TaxID=762261 RepID=UPI003B96A666
MNVAGTHERNTGAMHSALRCGARTRSGEPCRSPSIAGAARCRMHGGKGSGAPLNNRNALKHGACDREMRERNALVRELMARVRQVMQGLGQAEG